MGHASFSDLMKNSGSNLDKLKKQVEEMQNTSNYSNPFDEHLWKPKVDSSGTGQAVVRFLPPPNGEDFAYVKLWNHGFQGPGGWYIERSLTTLGQEDPVSEYNSELWNTGIEANKNIARRQKRRLNYFSNVYVIDDRANPENNGKVMIYQYGQKIFEKINESLFPEFEDQNAVNPFDFMAGADFNIRIKIVKVENNNFYNYDRSSFAEPRPFLDGDVEKLEALWNSQHSLQAIVDPKLFKSYTELKTRLNRVLGEKASVSEPEENAPTTDSVDPPWNTDSDTETSAPSVSYEDGATVAEEGDENLAFFKKLREED